MKYIVYVLKLLFSFSGKASRREFWLVMLMIAMTGGIFIPPSWTSFNPVVILSNGLLFYILVNPSFVVLYVINEGTRDVRLAILIIAAWSLLAIQMKRWRDRGEPGSRVLINVIPLYGSISALYQLGFFPGEFRGKAPRNEGDPSGTSSDECYKQRLDAELQELERRRKAAEEASKRTREESTRRGDGADTRRTQEGRSVPPPSPSPRPVSEAVRCGTILGLTANDTKEDIKKKYRDLVSRYHPDKVSHLGDEFKDLAHTKFKEINEAYKYFKDRE